MPRLNGRTGDIVWDVFEIIDEIGFRTDLSKVNLRAVRDYIIENGLSKSKNKLTDIDFVDSLEEGSDLNTEAKK